MSKSEEELIDSKINQDKEDCLQKIEDALETLRAIHKKENEYASTKWYYFPKIERLMGIIKEYYSDSDILNTFETDDLFWIVKERGSWELDDYVEKELQYKENSLRAEFEDELDAMDTDVRHQIDKMTPDELWNLIADVYGICSPYDYERMKHGIAKFIEKLNQSNYQTNWRRIAAAFFRKEKNYGADETEKISD